ncbi:MAG TPA: hypothetical protein VGG91_24675 [Myxococcaceae bacterium]
MTPLPPLLRAHPPTPSSEDLVQLKEGEALAREVEMFLFETAGPECIRAQVELTNPRAEEPITIIGRARSTEQ